MDDIELESRKEFARILTKAVRTVNTGLDGRPWGSIEPSVFSAERFGPNYIRLDYYGMGIAASMHASDKKEFCHAATQVLGKPMHETATIAYVLVVR